MRVPYRLLLPAVLTLMPIVCCSARLVAQEEESSSSGAPRRFEPMGEVRELEVEVVEDSAAMAEARNVPRVYRTGVLRRNTTRSSAAAPYALYEGAFGQRYLIRVDGDLDLSEYVGRTIVVGGIVDRRSRSRETLLVIDRVFDREQGLRLAAPILKEATTRDGARSPGRRESDFGNQALPNPLRGEAGAATAIARENELREPRSHESKGVHKDAHVATAAFEQLAWEQNAGESPSGDTRDDPSAQELPAPKGEPLPELLEDESFAEGELFMEDPDVCPQCHGRRFARRCLNGCGAPEWYWVRGEYLLWWPDGMRVPALITTSPAGTNRNQAGVLGEPGTSTLFGGGDLNDRDYGGWRIRTGYWTEPGKRLGVEFEYLELNDIASSFTGASSGDPILARPIYDIINGQESSHLVAYPGVVAGTVIADAWTEFNSAGGHLRWNICCNDFGGAADSYLHGTDGFRVDWIAGYRYARLGDRIHVVEDLTSLDNANPGTFAIEDDFRTRNEFHGGDLGMLYEMRRGRWVLDCLTRVALGRNHQTVRIAGSTVTTQGGTAQSYEGGVLAQRSNIGFYSRDEFSIIPEIGFNLGYQLTGHTRFVAGYTLFYFTNVVRAGDQIDRDVNTNLIPPPANPFAGPLRPQFVFRDTDFWVHGLNLGLDIRF